MPKDHNMAPSANYQKKMQSKANSMGSTNRSTKKMEQGSSRHMNMKTRPTEKTKKKSGQMIGGTHYL